MRKLYALLAFICITLAVPSLRAQIPSGFALTSFSTGYSSPVNISSAGDSRLFIVQQRGRIFICDSLGNKVSTPFLDIASRVSSSGSERGLLGLAFDPNYALNGYFFVNYTRSSDHATVIARYTRDFSNPNLADFSSERVLLVISQPYSNHNGGHIAFGPDGYLYIGMGDGGSGGDPGNRSQNPMNLLGKMLRIDVSNPDADYEIPASNPFVSAADTAHEIWAIGVRNPWKYSFDKLTGDLWIGDVGQDNWEEVDFQPASAPGGENYGWRCYEADVPYDMSACSGLGPFTYPIAKYSNTASSGCSITGGKRYRGAAHASYYGTYLLSDYCTGKFWGIWDSAGTWVIDQFADVSDAINPVAFGENNLGELFVAGIGTGIIYRITDTTCAVTALISTPDSALVCSGSYIEALGCRDCTYEWYMDSTVIAGADEWKYEPSASGNYHVVVTSSGGCSDTSQTVYIRYSPAPVVSFSGLDTVLPYCAWDPSVTLVGSPAGGTFVGSGITGSVFDPSVPMLDMVDFMAFYPVVYTYTDSVGCTVSVSQVYEIDVCSSVNLESDEADLKVVPNPSNGVFGISCKAFSNRNVNMELVSPTGQVLRTWQATFADDKAQVELKGVSKGAYLLRVSDGAVVQSVRIVMQ